MAKQTTAPKASAAPAAEKPAAEKKAAAPKKAAAKPAARKTAAPPKSAKPAGKKPVLRGKAIKATPAKRKTSGSAGGSTAPKPLDLEVTEIITVVGPSVTVVEVYEEQSLTEIGQIEQIDLDIAGPDVYQSPLESRGTGPEAY